MVNRTKLYTWTPIELLTGTIVGEASGEGHIGQTAVACVIRNRVKSNVKWWGSGWRGVITKSSLTKGGVQVWQFSCWGDSFDRIQHHKETNSQVWRDCMAVARSVVNNVEQDDPTHGADSYFNPDVCNPSWATVDGVPREPTAIIGHHRFYRLET